MADSDCHVMLAAGSRDKMTLSEAGTQSFPWRRQRRSLLSARCELAGGFTSHDEPDLWHGRVDGVEHVATLWQRQFCVGSVATAHSTAHCVVVR